MPKTATAEPETAVEATGAREAQSEPIKRWAEIPGLFLVQDFVDRAEAAALEAAIDGCPWRTDLARRVQHYGWRYDYRQRTVTEEMRLGPLPEWVEIAALRVGEQGEPNEDLFNGVPDQVIVNEYHPGQGIGWHTDARAFGSAVGTLSLFDSWHMLLRKGWAGPAQPVLLPERSLLVMSGPARWEWQHSIDPTARVEHVPGRLSRARRRRVSVTFRTVNGN